MDPSKFECVICYEILIDPIVGSCGHDFCQGCVVKWQARAGRDLRCPVCRRVFSDTGEKLGVCVRLRELVESLFPDKVAARRAELERQATALREHTGKRMRLQGFSRQEATTTTRRRLHARRHQMSAAHRAAAVAATATATATAAAAAAAGGAAVFGGLTAAGQAAAPAGAAAGSSVSAQGMYPAAAPAALVPPLLLNVTANSSSPAGLPLLPELLQQQVQHAQLQLQAAMAHAASQLQQQLGGGAAAATPGSSSTGNGSGSSTGSGSSSRWPILDVQFTMGWYEPRCTRGIGRRTRSGRRGRV